MIETAKSVPISLEQFPRLADQARNPLRNRVIVLQHGQFLLSLRLQPERLDQIPELEVVAFHELAQLLGAAGSDL